MISEHVCPARQDRVLVSPLSGCAPWGTSPPSAGTRWPGRTWVRSLSSSLDFLALCVYVVEAGRRETGPWVMLSVNEGSKEPPRMRIASSLITDTPRHPPLDLMQGCLSSSGEFQTCILVAVVALVRAKSCQLLAQSDGTRRFLSCGCSFREVMCSGPRPIGGRALWVMSLHPTLRPAHPSLGTGRFPHRPSRSQTGG